MNTRTRMTDSDWAFLVTAFDEEYRGLKAVVDLLHQDVVHYQDLYRQEVMHNINAEQKMQELHHEIDELSDQIDDLSKHLLEETGKVDTKGYAYFGLFGVILGALAMFVAQLW